MRKLIVSNLVSLDGNYEGPGKDFMAMPLHACFDTHNAELLDAADILLLGGTTYRMFASFWPAAADNPEITGDNRRIADRTAEVRKWVVSDSLAPHDIVAWGNDTEVVRRAQAHAHIAELRRGDGGDIVVFGSGTLANDLLSAGLVDELHLMFGPAAVGKGTPMFTRPVSGLRLLGIRTFDGTDHVVLRYATAVTTA